MAGFLSGGFWQLPVGETRRLVFFLENGGLRVMIRPLYDKFSTEKRVAGNGNTDWDCGDDVPDGGPRHIHH